MSEKSQKEIELQAIVDWVKAYVAIESLKGKGHIRPVAPEAFEQYATVVERLKETLGTPDLEV